MNKYLNLWPWPIKQLRVLCLPENTSEKQTEVRMWQSRSQKWGASEKNCQKENLDRGEKALEEQMRQARKTWKLSRLASLTMSFLCADLVTSIRSIAFLVNPLTRAIRVKRVFLVVSPSARIDCQRDDLWAHRKLSSPPVLCHSALLPCTALPCVNKEPDKSLLCPWYNLICGSQLALIVDLSSWKALFWLVTQHFITSLDRPEFRGNDTKANKWLVQYGERCVSSGTLFWFNCD